MNAWFSRIIHTFDGSKGDAKFDGGSLLTTGLNTCGFIPISVIWGLGVLGGNGGLIITYRIKVRKWRELYLHIPWILYKTTCHPCSYQQTQTFPQCLDHWPPQVDFSWLQQNLPGK